MPKERRALGRIPPACLEAEACVLGSMLLDAPGVIARVGDFLRADDFHRAGQERLEVPRALVADADGAQRDPLAGGGSPGPAQHRPRNDGERRGGGRPTYKAASSDLFIHCSGPLLWFLLLVVG